MIMKLLAAMHLFLDEWTYCWLNLFGMLLLKVIQNILFAFCICNNGEEEEQ